jgi:hypothetical protein
VIDEVYTYSARTKQVKLPPISVASLQSQKSITNDQIKTPRSPDLDEMPLLIDESGKVNIDLIPETVKLLR